MKTTTTDVLFAIEARTARFPLVMVEELLDDTGLPPREIRAALERLYQQGAIELRPESGVRTLPQRVKDASPQGMRGVYLTTVRLLGEPVRMNPYNFVPNKPWSDKAILDAWPQILAFANKHKLPLPPSVLTAKRKAQWKEYGCGQYGCVFPSTDPDVVFKVTNDDSEVEFILRLASLKGVNAAGLVEYHGVLPIPASRGGKPLVAVWRESAREAGNLDGMTSKNKELRLFAQRLHQTTWYALGVRNVLKEYQKHRVELLKTAESWMPKVAGMLAPHLGMIENASKAQPEYWDDSRRLGDGYELAMNIGAYSAVCNMLATESPAGALVGTTMASLLGYGIVLADVHTGNVGLCVRGGEERWVITDPGRMLVVDYRAPAVRIKPWAAKP